MHQGDFIPALSFWHSKESQCSPNLAVNPSCAGKWELSKNILTEHMLMHLLLFYHELIPFTTSS